jgi:outer membrane protein insertion porin family
MVDLVYSIDEDRPYRVGVIRVHINGEHPHTKQSEVLNRLPFAPGDLASREKIKLGETKLRNSQIFAGAIPGQANAPRIAVAPPEFNPDEKKLKLVRGQSDVEEPPPSSPLLDPAPPLGPQAGPLFSDEPPAYLPYDVYVDETQTGRLMFGVGVNSNAGLVGSVVLEENNFDLFRPPTSFQDVLDGTAFRGGGQQFRIEAVPGTQLSRYLISWRDPYFLDQNVSFGVSGFYYQRFFPNWDEQRMGGNLTLGQMFTPQLSGAIRLRLENVNISNPSVPTPQTIQQTVGDNFLSTIRFSLAHDTRDSSFLPGKGHFVEASYEQGIADFVYPRAELEARQYWTLRERPDGGNRHIFSAVGQVGWVDNGAPFFEKFFAGGFQSFRGFAFYGVTPRENGGIRIGGRWQALGSLEYMVPITADDTIQIVGFTDFGTVEDQVTFDEFRVSVGGGVRLTIPAMGPVPIAIDFGVPIVKQGFDNTQLVAFYVGVLR